MRGPPPARRRGTRAAVPAAGLTCGYVSGHNPPGPEPESAYLYQAGGYTRCYPWLLSLAMDEYGKPGAKTSA
jgi:hypothetical protein